SAAQSGAYAITAATPDGARSAISTDATTYVSGSDMLITVTLKDGQDNAVTGAAASLTAVTVTVPNAILKAGSRWRDNGDGTYTATYTAATAGTELRATVRLSGRGNPASSDAYAITAATPDGARSAISTDATTYVSGSDMA
ncbi:invasin, partial [Salmonella enterica]|nr:invasin [Salmonella enterica]